MGACTLKRRSTGSRCTRLAEHAVTAGCLHEHVRTKAMCTHHLEHDDILCGPCHVSGHECKMTILSVTSL